MVEDTVYGTAEVLGAGSKSRGAPTCWLLPGTQGVYHEGRQRRARTVAKHLAEEAWLRASAGRGSKGERLYEWACVPLPDPEDAQMGRWLVLRRNIDDPSECAYYLAYGAKRTPVQELIRIVGRRWQIEDCFGRPRERSAWTSTKYAIGTAGTGTRRLACWHTLTSRGCCGPSEPVPRGETYRKRSSGRGERYMVATANGTRKVCGSALLIWSGSGDDVVTS